MTFKYGLLRGTHRAKRQAIYVQLLRQALPVTDCCLRERFRYISLQYNPFLPCISLSYSVPCLHLYPRPTQICGLRPLTKLMLLTIQFVGSSCFRYTTCHMLHTVHEAFFESSPDFFFIVAHHLLAEQHDALTPDYLSCFLDFFQQRHNALNEEAKSDYVAARRGLWSLPRTVVNTSFGTLKTLLNYAPDYEDAEI